MDKFSAIEEVDSLTDGLAIIMLVGPALMAPEGLKLARKHLPIHREELWHRLDRDGPDLAITVAKSTEAHPIILVHGLEYQDPDSRYETEVRLNLLRDTLNISNARIFIWIPQDDLETFARRCADLWHWRSIIIELSENDIEISECELRRRQYLISVMERTWGLHRSTLVERLIDDEPYLAVAAPFIEPQVLCDQEPMPFMNWAHSVLRGVLTGPVGGGKTAALRRLIYLIAREALQDGKSVGIPVALIGTRIAASPEGTPANLQTFAQISCPSLDALDTLASTGSPPLWVFVDECYSVRNTLRLALRRLRPDDRLIFVDESETEYPYDWQVGRLQPWTGSQQAALVGGVPLPTTSALLPSVAEGLLWPRTLLALAGESSASVENMHLLDKYYHPQRIFGNEKLRYRSWISVFPHKLPRPWHDVLYESVLGPLAIRSFSRRDLVIKQRDLADAMSKLISSDSDDLERNSIKFIDWLPLLKPVSAAKQDPWQKINDPEAELEFTSILLTKYLTARVLIRSGLDEAMGILSRHYTDPWWHDVIILSLGRLFRLQGFDSFEKHIWSRTALRARGDNVSIANIKDMVTCFSLAINVAREAGMSRKNLASYLDLGKEQIKKMRNSIKKRIIEYEAELEIQQRYAPSTPVQKLGAWNPLRREKAKLEFLSSEQIHFLEA